MATPEFETIDLRGHKLRILRAGAGDTLLWLRGSDASDTWRPWMEALAQHFDVIAPEHPGFGNVERPEWLTDISDMAMFYLDLIDGLGLDRVHLGGHGLGGWIAAEMAIRDPRKLATLTLCGAAGLLLPGQMGEDPFLRSEEDQIADQFFGADLGKAEQERRLVPETEDVRIANQMVIAQLAWAPRWHDPHLVKWLHRIALPTLIVWGEQDKVVPLEHARTWRSAIAGAQLVAIPSCGHNPPVEKTTTFVEALTRFVSEKGAAS